MTLKNGIRVPGLTRVFQYRKGIYGNFILFLLMNDYALWGGLFPALFTALLLFNLADEEARLVKTTVALVNWTSTEQQTLTEFTYLDGESEGLVWPSGVPSDGSPIEVPHYPFLSLMVLVYLFAAAGLVFTVVCLIFNVVFRNRKSVTIFQTLPRCFSFLQVSSIEQPKAQLPHNSRGSYDVRL